MTDTLPTTPPPATDMSPVKTLLDEVLAAVKSIEGGKLPERIERIAVFIGRVADEADTIGVALDRLVAP